MENDFIKIISATYKFLDYFPEGDPLKNRAKEKALAILERPTLDDIEVLEKYLELAKGQGWIDGMNFLIIQKEWQLIGASLQKQITNNKLQITNKSQIQNVKSNSQPRLKDNGGELLTGRQKSILKILAETKKAQVQDIIKEMPDVTKRTIRRDLDDLLKKKEIMRMGEFNQVFYQKS